MRAEELLPRVLEAFDFGAKVTKCERYGMGHINDTFCVETENADGTTGRRFILQRISPSAFKHPDEVMSNIMKVTDYLAKIIEKNGGDRSREAMEVIRTKDGRSWYSDQENSAWRVYTFVENTVCCQSADTPELFAASGRAFGNFQRMLQGFPASELFETIPRFHDTEDRLHKFQAALEADVMGRAKDCAPEISFVQAHAADCSVALQAQREGVLPTRVTHNDTKLNNVLMDDKTGEGVCIIDLDTVMPGLAINDFGDSIRFGANHCAEDETDLSKMSIDLGLYETYVQAFLEGAGGALTDAEIKYLPWGAKLMTLECGIRFLTDYLEGDHYFHTDPTRPQHNLDRCRTQFKLVSDMEAHWDEMEAIVNKYRK